MGVPCTLFGHFPCCLIFYLVPLRPFDWVCGLWYLGLGSCLGLFALPGLYWLLFPFHVRELFQLSFPSIFFDPFSLRFPSGTPYKWMLVVKAPQRAWDCLHFFILFSVFHSCVMLDFQYFVSLVSLIRFSVLISYFLMLQVDLCYYSSHNF